MYQGTLHYSTHKTYKVWCTSTSNIESLKLNQSFLLLLCTAVSCNELVTTVTNYLQLSDILYAKSQTHFKRQENLRYVFIHKQPNTLRYAIFHEIFEIGSDTLRYVTFLYTKSRTLRKKQDTLRYIFKYIVRLIWIAHFASGILILHHYRSDLAHLSDFDTLVIGISKSKRWAKKLKMKEL